MNCIYIDPPYNTGNEGWCYNDNVNDPRTRQWLKGKSPVDNEDLQRHDKWLTMMWPRLQLLKQLLAEDGVIFISIDDNERHRLQLIMDEIFGQDNFRNIIAVSRVKKNIKERETVKSLNSGYNSILFYARSHKSQIVPPTKTQKKAERWHAFDAPGIRPTLDYELFGERPPKDRHWMYKESIASDMIKTKRLRPNPRTGKPQYLLNKSDETMLDTNWTDIQESSNKIGFRNGEKNPILIKRLLQMTANPDAIVLDSFAGSGTTAEAVLRLNKEDGGNRRFILIECEDYADQTTAERVRNVIKTDSTGNDKHLRKGLGNGFAYCTLGEALSIESMLKGEQLPDYDTLARHLVYTAEGKAIAKAKLLKKRGRDGLFYETSEKVFYLIYEPDVTFLESSDNALNREVAERIANQISSKGKAAVVYATHKYINQKDLTNMNISYCGLPYGVGW